MRKYILALTLFFASLVTAQVPGDYISEPGCKFANSLWVQDGIYTRKSCLPRPSFEAPLTTSIVPARGGAATFTRASTATVLDWESRVVPVLSGEARFQGAMRVYNWSTPSEDVTHVNWVKSGLGTGTTPTITANFAVAPDGTTTADRAQFDRGAGNTVNDYSLLQAPNLGNNGGNRYSVYLKSNTASSYQMTFSIAGNSEIIITVTPSWQRFSTYYAPVGAFNGRIGLRGNVATSQTADISVWGSQHEGTLGQSNINPGPYVSAAVLSAPFHGANVDAAKYFDYQNGNTVNATTGVVTEAQGPKINAFTSKWAYSAGINGSGWTSPDSVASSITGSIDIRVKVMMVDWTPTVVSYVLGKYNAAGTGSYIVSVGTTGLIGLEFVDNTSTLRSATSNAANTFADGTTHWIRVTLNPNNGAAGRDFNFYTSDDGVNWTALGTQVTQAGATSIQDGTDLVTIGAWGNTVGNGAVNAKIYRAQIYNGINGTLAVDFDPNQWTSGTTWTSPTTGEVWTVVGSNVRMFGGPRLWDLSGVTGYYTEESRGNLLLQSETLDNASWTKTNVTISADSAVAPDGKSTADKILETNTVTVTHDTLQAVAKAAANIKYTCSAYIKAAERFIGLLYCMNNAASAGVQTTFNVQTGTTAATTTFGAGFTAGGSSIVSHGNGWYRISTSFVSDADTVIKPMIRIADNSGVESYTGTTGSGFYAWGTQLEDGTTALYPDSYIPTTTVAVTRAGDVLSYPVTNVFTQAQGTGYTQVTINGVTPGNPRLIGSDGGPNTISAYSGAGPSAVANTIFDSVNSTSSGSGDASLIPLGMASTWQPNLLRTCAGGGGCATVAAYTGTILGTTPVLMVGASVGQPSHNGTVRNFRIWQVPLTVPQIATLK